jgi:hypothetical protein
MPGKIKKPATKKKPVAKKKASPKKQNASSDSATLKRLRKTYPNSNVTPIRNSSNYSIRNKKGGGSVTVTPGRKKKK